MTNEIIKRLVTLLLLLPLVALAQEEIELPPMHHVVKVTMPKSMQLPDDFPLNDQNQIDCETCHGIKDIENTPVEKVDKSADNFHRGGPYQKLSNFCFRCHEEKAYQRRNIHKLLDDNGKYEEKDCEYCHKKAPDPTREIVRQDLEFRLPPQKLCFGCHLKTPHLNALTHQVKPDKPMLKRIQQSEQDLGVILPLDSDGKIMCATCHATHESGLIDPETPAGKQVVDATLEEGVSYLEHPWNAVFMEDKKERLEQLVQETGKTFQLSYQRLENEVLLRLSAKDGSLCQACHELAE